MSRDAGSAARPQRRGRPLGPPALGTPQGSAEAPRPGRTHETRGEGPRRGRTRPRQAARPRHSPPLPLPPPPRGRAHDACAVRRGAGLRGGLPPRPPPRPPPRCGFRYAISRDWQRLGSSWGVLRLAHADAACSPGYSKALSFFLGFPPGSTEWVPPVRGPQITRPQPHFHPHVVSLTARFGPRCPGLSSHATRLPTRTEASGAWGQGRRQWLLCALRQQTEWVQNKPFLLRPLKAVCSRRDLSLYSSKALKWPKWPAMPVVIWDHHPSTSRSSPWGTNHVSYQKLHWIPSSPSGSSDKCFPRPAVAVPPHSWPLYSCVFEAPFYGVRG